VGSDALARSSGVYPSLSRASVLAPCRISTRAVLTHPAGSAHLTYLSISIYLCIYVSIYIYLYLHMYIYVYKLYEHICTHINTYTRIIRECSRRCRVPRYWRSAASASPSTYTLHPTPYTLHPTSHPPTPYTPHPPPSTPHPTTDPSCGTCTTRMILSLFSSTLGHA
jgi:hypothetical protein